MLINYILVRLTYSVKKGKCVMGNNTAIQLRNDTAANWTTDNPTLAAGEMGLETDTNRIKFGNGSTAWTSLSYVGVGASFKDGLYTLSANQTGNVSINNHIEFNTLAQGSLNTPSTGSGQDNGIITLAGGKTYKISGAFMVGFSTSGSATIGIYDRTNSTYLGQYSHHYSINAPSLNADQPTLLAIITPVSNIDIDARFYQSSNASSIFSSNSWLLIEEYGGY